MSGTRSPTFADERVYRFISDPSHKENLSGRVRAACLTCRRKKIKCSGERNCRTCREKGLFCEGFPARKRLKRDGDLNVILDPIPAGIDRKRKISAFTKSISTPSTQSVQSVQSVEAADSDSSGPAGPATQDETPSSSTAAAATREASAPAWPSLKAKPNTISSLRTESPAPFQVNSWRLDSNNSQLNDVSQPQHPNMISTPDVALEDYITSAPPHQTSFSWDQTQDDEDWWTDRLVGTPGLSRRQTIASFLPLPSPGGNQFESRYEVMQPCIGAFDDLALLLATSRTPTGLTPGITPGVADFSSWWDVSSMTPAFLEQAQGGGSQVLKSQQPHQQPTPAYQHTPSSIGEHQQSTNAFFDHLWNNLPPPE